MRIAVFVKQVVDVRTVRIDAESGKPTVGEKPVMNTADAVAVAWAVDLKERIGAETTAVSLGPKSARETLMSAMATGIDGAIHVVCDAPERGDSLATARALAEAVREEAFDILVAGPRTDDNATGQVGIQIAEVLGIPHLSGVLSVDAGEDGLRVQRDVDGFPEETTIAPPVMLILKESEEGPTRHPSLRGMMQAKRKPLREVTPSTPMSTPLTWSEPMGQRVSAERILIEGEPADVAAAKLAAWLREHRLVG